MTQRTASILTALGGGLLVLGAILPWAVVRSGLGSIETPGIEGDGVFSLGCGVLIGLIGLVRFDKPISPAGKLVVLALAALAAYVVVQVFTGLSTAIGDLEGDTVRGAIGTGLYVSGLGVLLSFVGGLGLRTTPRLVDTTGPGGTST